MTTFVNLGWPQISQDDRNKIVKEIIDHIQEGNHVCRVGWACEKVTKRKVQSNVLDKIAARVTESGEYVKEQANNNFEYDWNIRKASAIDLEAKLLDIKTKKRQLNWFYPLLIISISGAIITGVSVFINYRNLNLQEEKVKYLEEEVKSLKTVNVTATTTTSGMTQVQKSGENLFMIFCQRCHEPIHSSTKDGSRLEHVFDRMPKGNFFKRFILNSDSLKKSGEPYSNHIDKEYNSDYDHYFKNLSDKDIADITEYLKQD